MIFPSFQVAPTSGGVPDLQDQLATVRRSFYQLQKDPGRWVFGPWEPKKLHGAVVLLWLHYGVLYGLDG